MRRDPALCRCRTCGHECPNKGETYTKPKGVCEPCFQSGRRAKMYLEARRWDHLIPLSDEDWEIFGGPDTRPPVTFTTVEVVE